MTDFLSINDKRRAGQLFQGAKDSADIEFREIDAVSGFGRLSCHALVLAHLAGVNDPPRCPDNTACISASSASAIDSGESAPMSSPAGPCNFPSNS